LESSIYSFPGEKRGRDLKHAVAATLANLNPLLEQIRQESLLRERTPGAFYLKSSGFLHFHEDPAGIFADLKMNGSFQRFAVTTPSEQQTFIEMFRELMISLKN
jgi:hypothetical protein